MKREVLIKQLVEYIEKLKEPDIINSICNNNNKLFRYDSINRILINMQYSRAYDVRTKEEWALKDINVQKSRPIYILSPIRDTKLVDTSTGEEFINQDLNPLEINLAIKNGLLSKSNLISDFEIIPVFDIIQTDCSHNSESIQLDRQILLNILYSITSCEIRLGKELKADYKKNIIEIPNIKYDKLASVVATYIVKYDMMHNIKGLSESTAKVLASIEKRKIETLFGCDSTSISADELQSYDIINFLDISDSLVNRIVEMISEYNDFVKTNYEYDIKNNIRAKKLINIMGASYINNKISE